MRPLAPSDIIVLEYIANNHVISKLEGNETVSLKFSKKLKSFTKKQVSRDRKILIHLGRTEVHIAETRTLNDVC